MGENITFHLRGVKYESQNYRGSAIQACSILKSSIKTRGYKHEKAKLTQIYWYRSKGSANLKLDVDQ